MNVKHTYTLVEPRPLTVEIHSDDCGCTHCEAFQPPSDALTAADFGKLTAAGIAIGNLIAFAVDPIGSARTLAAVFGLPL